MPNINIKDLEMKIIAFYLPQYHSIPENDKAWGTGFTEWTNVKKAQPLFDNHYQPKVPLDNNYYSLLDTRTQKWQSELAKKYGVFGFCYYHYWFKNGKKLLEKPAENMLENREIDTPFCFCWANENWTRNWDGGNKEIIVKQDYGNKSDWENHFQYLLPFFQDSRYILLDGAPILLIYKPELIDSFSEMSAYIKKRCIDYGFTDCKIIVQFPDYINSDNYDEASFDYYTCFEPAFTLRQDTVIGKNYSIIQKIRCMIKGFIGAKMARKISTKINLFNKPSLKIYDYDMVWDLILNRIYKNKKFIAGAFVDWDNTARNKNGALFIGADPQKFALYLKKLINKIKNSEQPNIIFINAWNEWAEGAYLEPDEKNGYGYLDAIKENLQ